MKVIVEIGDSVSREEIQSWIDEILMPNPAVIDAHIACTGCKCGNHTLKQEGSYEPFPNGTGHPNYGGAILT